jgi:urease accessory protein
VLSAAASAASAAAADPGVRDWLLWQLADSAFPSGGFAHSGGLEAAWQAGEVRSQEELAGYLEAAVEQAGAGSLPFVTGVFAHPRRFAALDRRCGGLLLNHVANRASRAQGQALLLAAARCFPGGPISGFRAQVQERGDAGHLAPVFGALACPLGLDLASAQRLFLFLALRSMVAAAVRLGILGPMDGQAMQARLAPAAEEVRRRCGRLRPREAAQTAPLLDLWQGAHDRLYSRLFQT